MIIGYARVSTKDQNLDMQIDAIEKYAEEKGEKCRIFQEKASGGKVNRKELDYALSLLSKGDEFVVYKIDRLARSTLQLITYVEMVGAKKAQFVSLSDKGMDTTTAGGKLLFDIMGSVAEFERSMIRERTKSGLEAARKRGKVGGRPTVSNTVKSQVRKLHAAGESASDISKEYGIGRSTVYKILNEEKE